MAEFYRISLSSCMNLKVFEYLFQMYVQSSSGFFEMKDYLCKYKMLIVALHGFNF